MYLEAPSLTFLPQCINGRGCVLLQSSYHQKFLSYVVEDVGARLELDLGWALDGPWFVSQAPISSLSQPVQSNRD